MKKCKGWFGKIFGHCFKTWVTQNYNPSNNNYHNLETDATKRNPHNVYEEILVCKRCGVKLK